MQPETIQQHLATLRNFYREGRAIRRSEGSSYDAQDRRYRALGDRMVEWAERFDLSVAVAQSLEEAVIYAYAQVVMYCHETEGMSPGWETFCVPPEEDQVSSGEWRVCWESGPSDWGIADSLGAGIVVSPRFTRGSGWYTEPYYSFDLCFVSA